MREESLRCRDDSSCRTYSPPCDGCMEHKGCSQCTLSFLTCKHRRLVSLFAISAAGCLGWSVKPPKRVSLQRLESRRDVEKFFHQCPFRMTLQFPPFPKCVRIGWYLYSTGLCTLCGEKDPLLAFPTAWRISTTRPRHFLTITPRLGSKLPVGTLYLT